MSLTAYSQTLALNSKGDTVICYSVYQAKYMLKQMYFTAKLLEEKKVDSLIINKYDSLLVNQRSVIKSLSQIVKNDKVIILDRESAISDLVTQLEKSERKIKKQNVTIKILTVTNITTITLLIIKSLFL